MTAPEDDPPVYAIEESGPPFRWRAWRTRSAFLAGYHHDVEGHHETLKMTLGVAKHLARCLPPHDRETLLPTAYRLTTDEVGGFTPSDGFPPALGPPVAGPGWSVATWDDPCPACNEPRGHSIPNGPDGLVTHYDANTSPRCAVYTGRLFAACWRWASPNYRETDDGRGYYIHALDVDRHRTPTEPEARWAVGWARGAWKRRVQDEGGALAVAIERALHGLGIAIGRGDLVWLEATAGRARTYLTNSPPDDPFFAVRRRWDEHGGPAETVRGLWQIVSQAVKAYASGVSAGIPPRQRATFVNSTAAENATWFLKNRNPPGGPLAAVHAQDFDLQLTATLDNEEGLHPSQGDGYIAVVIRLALACAGADETKVKTAIENHRRPGRKLS